jgi:hypothetical protein
MADVKISGLPASTVPLAGTEVLPIVQSGVTKQVANNDLRPKQIQSNATSGVLQVAGPGAAATRVMTTPDANFTAARIDAAQSFTGDQTLSTGNLVIGTSGQGIDFAATPGTGTSELLADYEEGTWTPIPVPDSGAITSYTSEGYYTKIGRQVTVEFRVTITDVGTATALASITGLPFANNFVATIGYGREAAVTGNMWQYRLSNAASSFQGYTYNNLTTITTSYSLFGSITYFN